MGLLEECQSLFGTDDLFKVLDLSRDANESKIKKAYYKMSLKVHPDKSTEDNLAENTQKFQVLSKIHKILSDKGSREAYLEHGDVDEEGFINENVEWVEYWRNLYPKVTIQNIEKYKKKYQNSEEEKNDLLDAYKKSKGDMDKIMDEIPCSTIDDEPRFREFLQNSIDEGKIKAYKAFTGESKAKRSERKRKADEEADEAKAHARDLGINIPGSSSDLASMIMARNRDRAKQHDSLIDSLAAKYAKADKKTKPRKKRV